MKVKVDEAADRVLDYMVAKAQKLDVVITRHGSARVAVWLGPEDLEDFAPSRDWNQGGPLMEHDRLQPAFQEAGPHKGEWGCIKWSTDRQGAPFPIQAYGPTFLASGMRCLVKYKLGSLVDVPKELLQLDEQREQPMARERHR